MENKKMYRVLPEYHEEWGIDHCSEPEADIVSMDEIIRLSRSWGCSVDELMNAVEAID